MVTYAVALFVITITAAVIKTAKEAAQVEVRAVLISCEPEDGESHSFDNEAMRFEREELFKHSVLKDCRQKLALTVRSASDPDNSGDEYIPIEHVFQGPKKRVRLLNPYVLRLQREPPLQAYKLRKIETVSGKLNQDNIETRVKRDSLTPDESTLLNQEILQSINTSYSTESHGTWASKNCFTYKNGTPLKRLNKNIWGSNRMKRYENDMIGERYNAALDINKPVRAYDDTSNALEGQGDTKMFERKINFNEFNKELDTNQSNDWKPINGDSLLKTTTPADSFTDMVKMDLNDLNVPNSNEIYPPDKILNTRKNIETQGKLYDMYEIGNADLWYTIQVQLFEKLSTPDGRSVWNDLSKGAPARVGSLSPEWVSPDISVRYRSTEWISREEFSLPMTTLCLLAPVKNVMSAGPGSDTTAEKYIVVPREDVVISNEESSRNLRKRDEKSSNLEGVSIKPIEQSLRQVIIRTSRALFGGHGDRLSIINKAGDQYLTLVHKQPYHAQVDLEARADENQLVHVGSSGRIMTVVADSSRQTRTVLTVQATNTGLAAARFRILARDCNPELPEIVTEKVNNEVDGCIVMPPKHTRSILLDLPFEIPVNTAHCSVALINGDGQSVAVRDVTIRKGDRCFCVWHCECVCLGEDPKLLCREMPEARQIAAGLSLHERTRHVRSVCYHDVLSLNICVTVFGVLTTLLLFGLVKASLGLVFRCIGTWGLTHVLQMPRKLDHYYETFLRDCKVVYDDEGWPVHPENKKRTVRLVSMSMEFILNLIFFITMPCVIFYDVLKQIFRRCKKTEGATEWDTCNINFNNHRYNANDMQGTITRGRMRRRALQRWMTPDAQDLSLNIWQKGVPVSSSVLNDMRPLLRDQFCDNGHEPAPAQESCGDSELDDTEYVLMQMQKSRESLAKSQRNINSSTPTTMKKQ